MLNLLIAASLVALPSVQDPEPQPSPPDPEVLEKALEELEQAFEEGEAADRIAAMEAHRKVLDPEVIAWIAKGLKDKDPKVQAAAIGTLRFQPHPEALKALHELYKRDKKLRKDDQLTAKLLKAIGQHGSPDSIDVLTDDVSENRTMGCVQARILGLGNIRSEESVEELMGLMKKAGRWKIQHVMEEFRLALCHLTGADRGESQEAWQAWWNDNKKTFEVAARPAVMPRQLQRRWDLYWWQDAPPELRPQRDREKRGGDGRRRKGG